MPDASLHVIEKRLKLAELVGCRTSAKEMVLLEREEGNAFVTQFLQEHGVNAEAPLIGFQAGASTVGRRWPSRRFMQLGKMLIAASPRVRVIITGSPEEYALCREIADGIGERSMVTAGMIPLKYMPSLVGRLRALLTGDTGILHMAIAVGTPVVALFVPSTPKDTGPLYDLHKHVVIHKEMPCNPCVSKNCGDPYCMELITVDEVFGAMRRFLP
jgi:ADP-heptose:LPS heptosyltransferase